MYDLVRVRRIRLTRSDKISGQKRNLSGVYPSSQKLKSQEKIETDIYIYIHGVLRLVDTSLSQYKAE